MDFKSSISKLEEKDLLETIEGELALSQVAPEIRDTDPAVLLNTPKGKVAANICTKKNISAIYGLERKELYKRLLKALKDGPEPKVSEKHDFKEIETDLSNLPVFKYHSKDAGRYITSAVYISESPNHGRNLSYHRTLVLGKNKGTLRLTHRNLWKYYKDAGEEIDVAICIGMDPAVLIAASCNVDIDKDELEVAGGFKKEPVEVVELENGISVPKGTEIVLLGKITNELEDEGPFVDMTGTVDVKRKQPMVEIDKILVNDDPIYHAIIGGREEHRFLMGFPREPVIFEEVSKVCDCRDVYLMDGGINWLHCAVAVEKDKDTDMSEVFKAVFEGHPSVKHVFAVDSDIDITSGEEVEWALATRFQGDKDLYKYENLKGSSLDPSATEGSDRRKTCKLGFDCTIPLDRNKKEFKKVV